MLNCDECVYLRGVNCAMDNEYIKNCNSIESHCDDFEEIMISDEE